MTGFALRVVGVTLAGFGLSALLVFWFLSLLLESYLVRRVDDNLKTEALDVVAVLGLLGPAPDHEQIAGELQRLGYTRGVAHHFFRVHDARDGRWVHSDLDAWPEVAEAARADTQDLIRRVQVDVFAFTTRTGPARPHGSRAVALAAGDDLILEVGMDLAETRALVVRGRAVFGVAMLAVLFLGSLLGAYATRKPLRGIAAVGQAAARVTRDMDFTARVTPPTGSMETDRLADAFNTMVDRIHGLLENRREMSDAIAHDIRSPVARMRAAAEAALDDRRDPELCGQVIEDCDRILHLVNTLLQISAAEAGAVDWCRDLVDLSALAAEAVELFEPLAELKHQQLHCDVAPGVWVRGDAGVLQRVTTNLLDNAAKYTDDGGRLHLALAVEDGTAVLTVTDTGRGISPASLARIFERFYRVDSERGAPGNGLGLSFCRAAAIAMGGSIEAASEQGAGSRFTVRLPAAAAPV